VRKIVIMGFGDVLQGDMGAGCTVLEKMAETVTGDDIDFAYMGRDTRFASTYLLDADLAVIAGALDLSGEPGSLHVWDQAVFESHVQWMVKRFDELQGLAMALAETKLVGGCPKHLIFLWMTPHVTEGYGISGLMQNSVIRAVWQIHREIWRMRLDQPPGRCADPGAKQGRGPLPESSIPRGRSGSL